MNVRKFWINIWDKLSFLKKREGFTITEMLVVISITVLLSTLALSYNRSSSRQLSLYSDQVTIVSALNRSKALALQRFNEPPQQGISVCGVGVKFPDSVDDSTYILFQDFVSSGNCDDSNYTYDTDGSEDLEEFDLGDRIEFVGDAASGLEILFIPPHLSVQSNVTFPADITIRSIDEGIQAGISVSAVGQITTQEVQ